MHDLKAAAKMMTDTAAATAEEMKVFRSGEWHDQAQSERDAFLLAAQALEALAWQAETQAGVRRKFTGNCWKWACYAPGGQSWFEYVADTPLGAILAAMEGERDA